MRDWFSRHRWGLLGGGVAFAVLLNVVVVVGYLYQASREYDPLDPFPVQSIDLPVVANAVDGGQYPTLVVRNNEWDDIPVSGEKCSEETVQVEGSYFWASVIPPGSFSDPSQGQTIRLKGCTKIAYRNRVPEAVRTRVRELAKQGVTSSVWFMQGKEIPFRPGTNDPGSAEFWSTRNFAIVWEE